MKKAITTLIITLLCATQNSFGLSIMRDPGSRPLVIEYQEPVKTGSRNIYLKQLKRDIDQRTQNVDQALQQKAATQDPTQLEFLNTYIADQRHMRDVLVEQRNNIESKNYTAIREF